MARFAGGRITSDAGGLLLRETEQATGILRQFAACFTVHRSPDLIEHTVRGPSRWSPGQGCVFEYNGTMTPPLRQLAQKLAKLATHYDVTGDWPERSLAHLAAAGAWTWIIPKTYGGLGLDARSQILAYETIAAGCLSSLLILTQRDGACELILSSENEALKSDLLPRLAEHALMTSVGLSQITTSHQMGKPALVAEPEGSDFRLKGFMPWVTAAEKCDFIVTGAMLPDHRQILAIVHMDTPGVCVDPAMKLMALESSRTSEVHCRDVLIPAENVLQGPAERALRRRSTVKTLVVAAAGVGLAGAMIRHIAPHGVGREGVLSEQAEELVARYEAVRERLHKFAGHLDNSDVEIPASALRVAVNDLVVRLAVGTLTYTKGSGFIRQREPQRLVREAMFFLVWSAPEEVRARTLAGFLHTPEPEIRSMQT